jgi:hypothetical protein
VEDNIVEDPMAGFLYALRSPISKKKYPQRFLGFNGVFNDDALEFLKKAREMNCRHRTMTVRIY